jgi:uncharacterized damage-inducible protein DinB
MEAINFGKEYLVELENEVPATRKCLERVSDTLYNWKPHEKSMNLGYLVLLVAEIPRWISSMIEASEIELATYNDFKLSTTGDLIKRFDKNIEGAKKVLEKITNKQFEEPFYLKTNGQVVYTATKKESVNMTINHWVHHRGQLTVYMRLNDIAVPSIYGPSADDKGF